ncbi:MAG: PorT family protein [Prolixibacteraceae bacterium]|nr:PorT family protein [Prolixibacteraceae bacterium]
MTVERHPIDQLFKDKLGNLEKNPPVGLMGKIDQQIAFRGKVRQMNQVKAVVGIAAAMVLIVMAGWLMQDQNQFSENKVPVQSQKEISPVQSSPLNKAVITSTPDEKLLAIQQHQATEKAVNRASKSKVSVTKRQKETTSSKEKDLLAAVPTGKGTENSLPQTNTVTKEEKKANTASNANQKKGEPIYFADTFNPNPVAKNSAKGSWRIKAELSPMFAPQITGGNSGTRSRSTVSGGMIASYQLNKKVSISTGIRYSEMKQGTHTDYTLSAKSGITYLEPVEKSANISRDVSLYLPSVSSIVYSNGMQAAATNVFASDISQDFKYLEIPVQATYKIVDSKVSVGVTGGFSTNILIGNYASITENGLKLSKGNTDNMRDVIYAGSAGIEFGYGLAKNLMLTVEPRLKQYMHSVSSNEMINFKPLQMGIFTGLTFSFE